MSISLWILSAVLTLHVCTLPIAFMIIQEVDVEDDDDDDDSMDNETTEGDDQVMSAQM